MGESLKKHLMTSLHSAGSLSPSAHRRACCSRTLSSTLKRALLRVLMMWRRLFGAHRTPLCTDRWGCTYEKDSCRIYWCFWHLASCSVLLGSLLVTRDGPSCQDAPRNFIYKVTFWLNDSQIVIVKASTDPTQGYFVSAKPSVQHLSHFNKMTGNLAFSVLHTYQDLTI